MAHGNFTSTRSQVLVDTDMILDVHRYIIVDTLAILRLAKLDVGRSRRVLCYTHIGRYLPNSTKSGTFGLKEVVDDAIKRLNTCDSVMLFSWRVPMHKYLKLLGCGYLRYKTRENVVQMGK